MKKIIAIIVLTCVYAVTFAQTPYTSSADEKHPGGIILNGILSKYILENTPEFNWYGSSRASYTPDAAVLTSMETAKKSIQFILFGGTWCEDTQFILPKFFKLQELSGFPDAGISFYGVNREKKTLGNLADAFKITNVPTIIVMKDGKEVGRVVEYGKTGKWDAEVAALINQP